ncbi:hypothetical protein GCM10022377_28260 [Zhihengliuella alba]|uniref:Uncharacterized protein n=1 Tax=Zhihengliuella alba TaxID=547018 RepID=A0ABP7E152_9MICC
MHLPEPTYPCYLPVLGEFSRMTPHEGPINESSRSAAAAKIAAGDAGFAVPARLG